MLFFSFQKTSLSDALFHNIGQTVILVNVFWIIQGIRYWQSESFAHSFKKRKREIRIML